MNLTAKDFLSAPEFTEAVRQAVAYELRKREEAEAANKKLAPFVTHDFLVLRTAMELSNSPKDKKALQQYMATHQPPEE